MKVDIEILKQLKNDIKDNERIEKINIYYITDRLAVKRSWSLETMRDFLNDLKRINRAAYCSVILKEIAIYLNSRYNDNIEEINKGWYISLIDGMPCYTNITYEPKGYATFRTLKDALAAWYVVHNDIIKLYE